MKEESPIAMFLTAVDSFDLDAAMSSFTSDARLLISDGRKVEGSKSVRTLLEGFLGQLRSVTHEIQAEWHVDDVWIAEATASYELQIGKDLKAWSVQLYAALTRRESLTCGSMARTSSHSRTTTQAKNRLGSGAGGCFLCRGRYAGQRHVAARRSSSRHDPVGQHHRPSPDRSPQHDCGVCAELSALGSVWSVAAS